MATVSEIKLPNVDLPKVEMPALDMSSFDLRASVADAAEAVGLRRPPRRSRWLFALGGVMLAAAAGWGLLRSPQIRARSQQVVQSVRERVSAMRPNAFDLDVGGGAGPIAFPAAEVKPIAADRWNDAENTSTPDNPDGLESETSDAIPTRQETKSRA